MQSCTAGLYKLPETLTDSLSAGAFASLREFIAGSLFKGLNTKLIDEECDKCQSRLVQSCLIIYVFLVLSVCVSFPFPAKS